MTHHQTSLSVGGCDAVGGCDDSWALVAVPVVHVRCETHMDADTQPHALRAQSFLTSA